VSGAVFFQKQIANFNTDAAPVGQPEIDATAEALNDRSKELLEPRRPMSPPAETARATGISPPPPM